MDPAYWHRRWAEGRIGFHEAGGNALIAAQFDALGTEGGGQVFVPLAGKSRDIAWLRARGHSVVAVELSVRAIEALFADMEITPDVTPLGPLTHFAAPELDVFAGDIFDFTAEAMGPVSAVIDRAALVALPEAMRARYATHLAALAPNAPMLLIAFDYDQTLQPGPPFSVPAGEIRAVFGSRYKIAALSTRETRLKELDGVAETAWHLRPLQERSTKTNALSI